MGVYRYPGVRTFSFRLYIQVGPNIFGFNITSDASGHNVGG